MREPVKIIIIIIIIKRKLKVQINRKTSQMRRDDAATENCRLQCRPNVNETEMSSTVSENTFLSRVTHAWSMGDARQICVYKDPWQISSLMLPVDFLLVVNSIRGRILLIVCDIFLRKEV